MKVENLINVIGSDFFVGVPDSLLKPLCNYLMHTYNIDPQHHIIAANEGNCVGLAAGYHMATGKIPVVYMQNSGEGNIVNPVTSLLNKKVYAIPTIFIIGWRGEPNVHDEPQHIFQGEITLSLLDLLEIPYIVVDQNLSDQAFKEQYQQLQQNLVNGNSIALVIKKGALIYSEKVIYKNDYTLNREKIIEHIVSVSKDDPIISTTGKASRELFEIRERNNQGHQYDFLTVGSMGHSSSIALAIAIQQLHKKIWCIDGDGAVLMHMGAMGVIGSICPSNLVHVVINNGSHETVGGLPTVVNSIDLCSVARACGYKSVLSVNSQDELEQALKTAKLTNELVFIEVKSSIGARDDLGRPTTTPIENKESFENFLRSKD